MTSLNTIYHYSTFKYVFFNKILCEKKGLLGKFKVSTEETNLKLVAGKCIASEIWSKRKYKYTDKINK